MVMTTMWTWWQIDTTRTGLLVASACSLAMGGCVTVRVAQQSIVERYDVEDLDDPSREIEFVRITS